jgi:hypothetical protein
MNAEDLVGDVQAVFDTSLLIVAALAWLAVLSLL